MEKITSYLSSLQSLESFIKDPQQFAAIIGPFGGRTLVFKSNAQLAPFKMDTLVRHFAFLSKKSNQPPLKMFKLIQKIHSIDTNAQAKCSFLQSILTKIRRFVGGLFYNRNQALLDLMPEIPSPKAHKVEKPIQPLPKIIVPPPLKILEKPVAPKFNPTVPVMLTPNPGLDKELKEFLADPEKDSTGRKRIFQELSTPHSVESLLRRAHPKLECDLNHPHSILILQGICRYCTNTTVGVAIDWMERRRDFTAATLAACCSAIVESKCNQTMAIAQLINLYRFHNKCTPEQSRAIATAMAKIIVLPQFNQQMHQNLEQFIKQNLIDLDFFTILILAFAEKGAKDLDEDLKGLLFQLFKFKGWAAELRNDSAIAYLKTMRIITN